MRKTLLLLAVLLLGARTAAAQITAPYTFTNGSVADADQVNANFAKFSDALNRTGGTMTGTLTTRSVIPSANNTYDSAATGTRWANVYSVLGNFSGTLTALTFSGSCASCTSIPASNLTGTIANATQDLITRTGTVTSGRWSGTITVTNDTSATLFNPVFSNGAGAASLFEGNALTYQPSTGTFAASIFSGSGASLTNLPAGQLTGTITSATQDLITRLGTIVTVANFSTAGTHTFSAASVAAGSNVVAVRNTTGTGYGALQIGNDSSVSRGEIAMYGTTFSTSGSLVADALRIASAGAGGLNLVVDAAATVNFYAGSTHMAGLAITGGSSPVFGVSTVAAGTGANHYGGFISAGRNSDGGGAPGIFLGVDKSGVGWGIWSDSSGVARISNAGNTYPDESSGDTAFSNIIGTQTSTLDTKLLIAPFRDTQHALDVVAGAPLWRFTYKSGGYGGSEFMGVMSNTTPEVMMDPSPEHPEGRAFSPVSAFGYTAAAIAELKRQLDEVRNPYKRLFRVEWK